MGWGGWVSREGTANLVTGWQSNVPRLKGALENYGTAAFENNGMAPKMGSSLLNCLLAR